MIRVFKLIFIWCIGTLLFSYDVKHHKKKRFWKVLKDADRDTLQL